MSLNHAYKAWDQGELHRLRALVETLSARGHWGEAVMGRADDGAPWFAFVLDDGATLIHVARIGGCYVVGGDARQTVESDTLDEALAPIVDGRKAA